MLVCPAGLIQTHKHKFYVAQQAKGDIPLWAPTALATLMLNILAYWVSVNLIKNESKQSVNSIFA